MIDINFFSDPQCSQCTTTTTSAIAAKTIGLTDSRRNRDMTSNDENKKQKKNKMK